MFRRPRNLAWLKRGISHQAFVSEYEQRVGCLQSRLVEYAVDQAKANGGDPASGGGAVAGGGEANGRYARSGTLGTYTEESYLFDEIKRMRGGDDAVTQRYLYRAKAANGGRHSRESWDAALKMGRAKLAAGPDAVPAIHEGVPSRAAAGARSSAEKAADRSEWDSLDAGGTLTIGGGSGARASFLRSVLRPVDFTNDALEKYGDCLVGFTLTTLSLIGGVASEHHTLRHYLGVSLTSDKNSSSNALLGRACRSSDFVNVYLSIPGDEARRSSAEHLMIATKALRLHSYGLDAHCR